MSSFSARSKNCARSQVFEVPNGSELLRLRELSVELGAGGKLETVTLGRERLDAWPRIKGTCPRQ
jgi:hypothetical protein